MPSSSRKYTRPQSRLLAIVTLLAMLMATVPMQVAAKSTDLEGHWGNDVIQRWIDRGLAGGYPDGTFRPDGKVTRAEFMKLINKSFAFVKEQDIGYSDVKENDWFFAEVRTASAAGYITGYEDGTIRPNDAISRQEVAVVFVRLKKFTLDPAVAEMFADQQTIDVWSRGAIGAVVREGLMKGYPDDTFKPKSLLTRAEAIASLDRGLPQVAITTVYDKAGTYGPETGKETVARDVVIESDGVVLQNLHVTGTLMISEKVGKGTVTLNNLTVDKKVIVRGGGKDSVYFNGGTYKEGVVVGNTPGGEVRIVAKADTALPIVVEQTATKQTVILDGKLSTVVADGKDNTIIANPKTEIETLKVNETAQQTIIKNEKDAIIKEMKTDAVVKIENNGVISKPIEGTKATESTVQLTGTKPVEPPAVVVAPVAPAPTPISGGGSSGGSTTPANNPPTNIMLSSTTIAENAGSNATVGTLSGADADANSTFGYNVNNLSIEPFILVEFGLTRFFAFKRTSWTYRNDTGGTFICDTCHNKGQIVFVS